MNYRILTLASDLDGNPVVPGAQNVTPQVPGMWTATGKAVRAASRAGCRYNHESVAAVIHVTSNVYCVFADDFSVIDPTSAGKDIKDYGGDKWPWKVVERTYDDDGNLIDETVTDTPTLPSEPTGSGMADMIQKEPIKAVIE